MDIATLNLLKPGNRNKIIEVRIYRKWISRNLRTSQLTAFSCILLDKQGHVNDKEYYDNALELNHVYRITNFNCQQTSSWLQTLDNDTSLRFGRHTSFKEIDPDDFPCHYFKFVPYNELESKIPNTDGAKLTYPTPIDYIGAIRYVGDPITTNNPNRNTTVRRHLDIVNINGQIVELTLWDALGANFDKQAWKNMEQPVLIAVSSCRVTKKEGPYIKTELQLTSSFATYYYLNPHIPEVTASINEYKQMYINDPPLQISKRRDISNEDHPANKYSLQRLLQCNPETYKGIRFTSQGTITSINTTRPWFYTACIQCNKKVTANGDHFICKIDGQQSQANYRYCFNACVNDNTTSANFSFFTPNADKLVKCSCSELITNFPNPYDTPPQILALIGKNYLLQFHYNTSIKQEAVEFIFDNILDTKGKAPAKVTANTPIPPQTPITLEETKDQPPATAKRTLFQPSSEAPKKPKTE